MASRKKRRFGAIMLVIGAVVLLTSMFLGESALRWVCLIAAAAFIIMAIFTIVGASGEPD